MRRRKVLHIIKRDGLLYTCKRALAFLLGHSPLAYRISFSYTQNTRLTFTPSLLTYAIFANHQARHTDVDAVIEMTPVGGTVIDVGGNIGSIAIPAAQHVGPLGQVLVFEPSPKFYRIIQANIKVNGFGSRIKAHQVALGSQAGTVYLNEAVADDTTNHIAKQGTAVPQLPLDQFTKDHAQIDFLKIDVEGYECKVLRGAEASLQKTKTILIECIPRNLKRSGSSVEELLALLTPHFDLFVRQVDGTLKPFSYNPEATVHPDLIGLNRHYGKN